MLVTPSSFPTILASSSLWSFVFTFFQVLSYLLLGALVFGVDMGTARILAAVVVLILTIPALGGIGIHSASFASVFKRGDPISFLVGSVSTLVGGVFYPITVLPTWLQPVSYLLPLTYSLSTMRRAILQGNSLSALAPDTVMLGILAAVLLPLGLVAFQLAVRRAKIRRQP